jgi:hypothetical protein
MEILNIYIMEEVAFFYNSLGYSHPKIINGLTSPKQDVKIERNLAPVV